MRAGLERYVRDLAARAERLEIPESTEVTFGRYRDDPVGFCRDILGVESATRRSDGTPYQFEILTDLAQNARVSVRSGHGIGKSTLNAWAALWWLLTRPMSRVVIVAPEFSRQIKGVLFAEIGKWSRRAKVPLPIEVLSSRVVVKGYGPEWGAIGVPATEPDRIEGFHGDAVLLILDETKGIPQDVYDALQGTLTGLEASRLLVTSTPGGPSGPFYRIWTRGSDWVLHHLSSTDSSMVRPAWCTERARDWGIGSPLYQARVLGEFPDAGEGVLFPLSLLEAAIDRDLEVPEHAPITLGVDVARSVAGDFNCVAVQRGGKLLHLELWRSADLMETTQKVLHEVTMRGAQQIRVDVGGVGGGVVDRLRQLGREVTGVHFGGAPSDTQRFKNRRAELYWNLRERLEKGTVSFPIDDELIADLSAVRYEFDQRGKIKLESKDDTRKRLGRSPDRADALVLACDQSEMIDFAALTPAITRMVQELWTPNEWEC